MNLLKSKSLQVSCLALLLAGGIDDKISAQTLTVEHAPLTGQLSSATPSFLFNTGQWLPAVVDFNPFGFHDFGDFGVALRPVISFTNTLLNVTANGAAVLTVTNNCQFAWNSVTMLGDPTTLGSASVDAYLLSELDFELILGGNVVFETDLEDFPTLHFTSSVEPIPAYGFSPGVTLSAQAAATGYSEDETALVAASIATFLGLNPGDAVSWAQALNIHVTVFVNTEDTLNQMVTANAVTATDIPGFDLLYNGDPQPIFVCGCSTNGASLDAVQETWSDQVNLVAGIDVGCNIDIPILFGLNLTPDLKDLTGGQPVTIGGLTQTLPVQSAPIPDIEFDLPAFGVTATSVNPPGAVTPAYVSACMGSCQTFSATITNGCWNWFVGNTLVQQDGIEYTLCNIQSNTAVTLVYTNCVFHPPNMKTPVVIHKTPAYCTNCPCLLGCSFCTNCPSGGQVPGGGNPNGSTTTVSAQYGPTTAYGMQSPSLNIGDGTNEVDFSFQLTNLVPNTTYHFQFVASNALGIAYSGDEVFSTPVAPPDVSAVTVSNVNPTGVQLYGLVNPNGLPATAFFNYFLVTTGFVELQAAPNPPLSLGASYANDAVSATLTGLSPGTEYRSRLVASNSAGIVSGSYSTFMTSASPPPLVSGTGALPGAANAVVSGLVNPQGLPTTNYFQWGTPGIPGAAFTFQGLLSFDGAPAPNGLYAMDFGVWDASTNGTLLGGPLGTNNVGVTNGLFAVTLNLASGVFANNTNWLQIALGPNGGGVNLLGPRQQLIPSSASYVSGNGYSLSGQFQQLMNGAFESGDFTGWTSSGNLSDTYVSTNSLYAYSNPYGAQLGPPGSLGFLSQSFVTTPGNWYLLSFWLDSPDGLGPNEFLAQWSGNALLQQTNLPATGWTNLLFLVQADDTNTVLEFGFRDDPSYLGLDDVSVQEFDLNVTPSYSTGQGTSAVPVSEFLTDLSPNTTYYFQLVAGNPAGSVGGNVAAFTTTPAAPPFLLPSLLFSADGVQGSLLGTPGINYSVQVSTDLFHWSVLTNVTPALGGVPFSDPSAAAFRQRFYRGLLNAP